MFPRLYNWEGFPMKNREGLNYCALISLVNCWFEKRGRSIMQRESTQGKRTCGATMGCDEKSKQKMIWKMPHADVSIIVTGDMKMGLDTVIGRTAQLLILLSISRETRGSRSQSAEDCRWFWMWNDFDLARAIVLMFNWKIRCCVWSVKRGKTKRKYLCVPVVSITVVTRF